LKLPTVQLSPFSRYFIPLRSKYSPQHPGWWVYSLNAGLKDDCNTCRTQTMIAQTAHLQTILHRRILFSCRILTYVRGWFSTSDDNPQQWDLRHVNALRDFKIFLGLVSRLCDQIK
jgi:hypothetical protein